MNECYSFLKDSIIDDNVVIAVSGGPDSMAVLDLVRRLREEKSLSIICAHVNHNVREESFNEKIMVENFCKENNIIFESMIIEKYSNDNFENEARKIRYKYFEDILRKYNCHTLITAHHGDDLIETVLMRLVRGSSLKGYSGFERVVNKNNYKILRPFITITKDDIYEYLEENSISFAIDKSNFEDIHTRNRYRKYIVPKLKEEDCNVHKKFYKFSKILLDCNNYIERNMIEVIDKVYIDKKIIINEFLKQDELIQKRILYKILEDYYQENLYMINDKHCELIYSLINLNKANSYILFPNNIKVVKSYNKLFLEMNNNIEEYKIRLDSEVILPNKKKIVIVSSSDDTSNYTTFLLSKDLKLPLYVRTKKAGDRMQVKGMNYSKKIKDIFINEKIPLDERLLWPVVVDSDDNIVWLPGLKKSNLDSSNKGIYDIIVKYQ